MKNQMDLEVYKRNFDFIIDTAKQIAKDFNFYSIDLNIDKNADDLYYELFLKIKPEIQKLLMEDYSLFREILYRIDLDEKKLKRITPNQNKQNEIDEITHLIIEREILKVATRYVFSGKVLK
jgi:hypothetical protein